MNTPTIFCSGGHPLCENDLTSVKRRLEGLKDNTEWYTTYGSEFMGDNSTYFLPFIPQTVNLDVHTIALNATHNATKNITESTNKTHTQYDVHSLFGHM